MLKELIGHEVLVVTYGNGLNLTRGTVIDVTPTTLVFCNGEIQVSEILQYKDITATKGRVYTL